MFARCLADIPGRHKYAPEEKLLPRADMGNHSLTGQSAIAGFECIENGKMLDHCPLKRSGIGRQAIEPAMEQTIPADVGGKPAVGRRQRDGAME